MINRYVSREEKGSRGAIKKALYLRDVLGYAVVGIEHTFVPAKHSSSKPYEKVYGKKEKGYSIMVDTEGYRGRKIPDIYNLIVEC